LAARFGKKNLEGSAMIFAVRDAALFMNPILDMTIILFFVSFLSSRGLYPL